MIEKIFTEDNQHFAVGPGVVFAVIDKQIGEGNLVPADSSIFRRNAIKMNLASGAQEQVQWLVGRLDGVAVYMIQDGLGVMNIIMSREDLYP